MRMLTPPTPGVSCSAMPLGGILPQRGLMVLHGSAVLLGDRAIALAGASGAGKSTTAAVLCSLGGRLICDDLCAINGAESRVVSGTSVLKLWPDSVEALGIESARARAVRPGLSKRFLPLAWPRSLSAHSKKTWNPPTLQPHDLIPSGGSIAGVSDVSVSHS